MFKSQAIAVAAVLCAVGALPAVAMAADPIVVSHASGGQDATDQTQTSVVLHAGVVANGHALSCEVDYARDNLDDPDTGPYTAHVPCREAISAQADGEQPVSVALSGLQPHSHYRFQFLIKDTTDATLTRHTNESTFNTLAVAPGVVTGGVTEVYDGGAVLNGTIDPHGDESTCRFDIGTTSAYDGEVSCEVDPGSGEGPVAVHATVTHLDAGVSYHYRLVGAKSDQEVAGADATFTMPAAGSAPGGATTTGGGGTTTTTGGGSGSTGTGHATVGHLSLPASAKVRGGRAKLTLRCASAACRGTLTLKAKVKRGGRTKTVTAGHATVNLAAGKTATVTIRLTSAAKSALRAHHALTIQVSGAGAHQSLRLS
jgi:hypothetical protein